MTVVGLSKTVREWPTWLTLAGCYTIWLCSIIWHDLLGWFWIIPAALSVTLHSSLQHEILHGHPTRSCAINEALVFPAVGLFVPYRRFRDTHLRHHNNVLLTDPYDDPETWYLSCHDWYRTGRFMRKLLQINHTLAGRMAIGPALALYLFWRNDLRLMKAGDRHVINAYVMHIFGLFPVIGLLTWTGIPLWLYAVCAAYPGMSILMIRTYIEHRAREPVSERTAVVEAGPVMQLLFLNNNYHCVHHENPTVPWYRLPGLWRQDRTKFIAENAGYHYPGGYVQVAREWLFRQREPVEHPFMRRNIDDPQERTFQPTTRGDIPTIADTVTCMVANSLVQDVQEG